MCCLHGSADHLQCLVFPSVFGVSQLVVKQQKTEEGLHRADVDYFNSLMQLERGRQEWETLSFECCDALEVSCTDHVLTGQDGWGGGRGV